MVSVTYFQKSCSEVPVQFQFSSIAFPGFYPIGSMVLLYMVTWIPSIYPLYVSINIPAPWIRHGFLVFHGFAHQTDTQRRVHSYNDVVMFRRSSRVDAMKIFFPSGPSGHGSHLGVSHHHLTYG